MRAQCVIAAWCVCLGAVLGARAQGPPPTPVRMAPVVSEEVAEQRMVTGELRSLRVAQVASQEAGVVVELLLEAGMRVEAGQVLARLDEERLVLEKQRTMAERAAAASAIAEEEALRERWQSEVTSLIAATERGASNAREQRDADAELSQATARVEKARRDVEVYDARLALLERRLKDMRILAPFPGVVTQKLSERGEWLNAGDSVCELVQTDELEVTLNVPQRYLPVLLQRTIDGSLRGGDLVVMLDRSESRLVVDNLRIVPQVDERSRTFRLLGRVHDAAGGLAAGLSVVGWVPTGASGAHLIVPTDAVMRNDMGAFVYVARQAGEGPAQAMPATIEVLFEMPGRVVVAGAGLHPGDRVIVEGNDRLYPTAPVRSIGERTEAENAGAAPGVGPGGGTEEEGAG